MFSINLKWLEFPLNLQMIEAWMRSNAGESYVGNAADDKGLNLWFSEVPEDGISEAILAYWGAMTEESAETVGYKSDAQMKEEAAAAKASALASASSKLEALGLSPTEISAILGQ